MSTAVVATFLFLRNFDVDVLLSPKPKVDIDKLLSASEQSISEADKKIVLSSDIRVIMAVANANANKTSFSWGKSARFNALLSI